MYAPLDIGSLNKHIDGLSNLLSLMKLNFPIIGLSEHKIGRNTSIYNISSPGYVFCFDETKSTHGGTGLFINKSYLYTKNLESTFIEINLPKKRIFLKCH